MVNQTITLVLEKMQDKVFIKPSSMCNDEINGTTCVQFNPSHTCDGKGCGCFLLLKEINSKVANVVHLNLSKCNLTLLPDSLCNLPLKLLNLSHNKLNDVPNCLLKGLDTLENLNLSHNCLKEFEIMPKCALNLCIIDLTYNNIQFIPIWIVHAKCRNLVELYYSHNYLGKTNESLYNWVPCSLKKMILQNCCIINDNIAFLKSIPTIHSLDISNDISSMLNNILTNCEELFDNPAWINTLEVLNMSRLRMGFLPDGMWSLMSLKELYLPENKIYWLPDSIGNLINLEVFDVSNNSICLLPNTFSGLINLCTLFFQHNNLSDCTILDSLPHLNVLDLYENDLDQFDLDLFKYDCLDLEKNYFQTISLDFTYVTKRENYRQKFNFTGREIGFYARNSEDAASNSSGSVEECYSSESDVDDRNVTQIDKNYEEECWDDEKILSHPDVTSSDDEWQGFLPMDRKVHYNVNLDHVLENLYDDVD